LQYVGGAVALAGLGARVSHQAEAHGHAVKVGGLSCVANIKLNVISAVQLQNVFGRLLLVVRKRTHKYWLLLGSPFDSLRAGRKIYLKGRYLDRPLKVGLTR
jgi:hypothetical protein